MGAFVTSYFATELQEMPRCKIGSKYDPTQSDGAYWAMWDPF